MTGVALSLGDLTQTEAKVRPTADTETPRMTYSAELSLEQFLVLRKSSFTVVSASVDLDKALVTDDPAVVLPSQHQAQAPLIAHLRRALTEVRSTQAEKSSQRFRKGLVRILLDDPIEDGVKHRGESWIEASLRRNPLECKDWLSRMLVEHYKTRTSLSASVLRCVGRLEYALVGRWGLQVVDDALHHVDVEVRDAAIRALEKWGGHESVRILRRHRDAEEWLNDYVRQVTLDLSGDAT